MHIHQIKIYVHNSKRIFHKYILLLQYLDFYLHDESEKSFIMTIICVNNMPFDVFSQFQTHNQNDLRQEYLFQLSYLI